jgi:dihydrodiol dehydrogenase / D-xylose 1-dehydrogenase (NADP)
MPLTAALQKIIHTDRIIGSISRIFVDFSLDMPISLLPSTARTAERSLGAGALLDIGIYTLTWASIILDQHPDNDTSKPPSICSTMSFSRGVDEVTSLILNYPALSCQAILTASMKCKSAVEFCRIEGSKGVIIVGGPSASNPDFILVREKGEEGQRRLDFKKPGRGFYFEADQIAQDLKDGKMESGIMPLVETLRIMTIMDSIRKANGFHYPRDT